MALRTSLTIAGDAAGATAALAATEKALAGAEAEAKQLADAFAKADVATSRLAAAQAVAARETAAAKAAFAAGEATLEEYNRSLLITKTELSLVASAQSAATANLRASQAAFDAAAGGAARGTVSLGQARAGYQNLGRQAQDVAVQLQGGMNIGTILAQQGPQVADALAMMGGRFSGLASFLAGPWGAAVFLAVGALGNLIPAIFGAGDASEKAQKPVLDLSGSFSALTNNADAATDAMQRFMDSLPKASAASDAMTAAVTSKVTAMGQAAKLDRALKANDQALSNPGLFGGGEAVQGLAISSWVLNWMKGRADNAVSAADQQLEAIPGLLNAARIADQNKKRLGATGGGGRKRSGGAKRSGAGANIDSFVDGAENRIAALTDQFSDLPPTIVRSNNALRDLDKVAGDLAAKSLPDYNRLVPALNAAGDAIRESLNKPFNDYLRAQRESAAIDQLLIAGRDDEAEALKRVLALQANQKALTKDQLDAVLATVVGERQRNQVLRDQRALIQANLGAVQDLRGALENTVGGLLRGKFSVDAVLQSIGNSFVNITSKRIVESMFGGTLRALEDQATGADKVQVASTGIASALDGGKRAVADFTTALVASVRQITTAASAPATGGGDNPGYDTTGMVRDPQTGEWQIPATADKRGAVVGFDVGSLIAGLVGSAGRLFGINKLPTIWTEGVKTLVNRLEQAIPNAIGGAFTGGAAAKLVLGGNGGGAGGLIGGALGQKFGEQFLGKALGKLGSFAGPIGSILGGLAGGLIGKLFGGTKYGSAAISNGSVTTAGNKGEFTSGASSAAGQVNSAIQKIAQALGGTVGDYAVSIGLTNGNWNVNPGLVNGKIGTKFQKDTVDFKKDEAGALAFAIANAVSDGAIKGISGQVAKALQSSPDIEKALAEATKVQNVEALLGGTPYQLRKALGDFESQAKERLRIATRYGFDVVALEKRNADDRLKLSQKLVADQVGSIQSLIDELTSGSLFEGSAVDQAKLLRDQIGAARAAVDAGTEGAADKLARLLEQLNAVSAQAFGSTGGYAADRTLILDVSRDAVAKANQRLADAQAASDPALATTNATLDEMAGQNAQIIAQLELSAQALRAMAAQSSSTNVASLAALARTS